LAAIGAVDVTVTLLRQPSNQAKQLMSSTRLSFNVLLRYDLLMQLWQKRGDKFNTLIDTWQDTRQLLTATEVGIPASPAI